MYQGPKFSLENLIVGGSRIEVIRYKLDVVWYLVLIFSSCTCSFFQSSMMANARGALTYGSDGDVRTRPPK